MTAYHTSKAAETTAPARANKRMAKRKLPLRMPTTTDAMRNNIKTT